MLAWMVTLYRYNDGGIALNANILMFGKDEQEITEGVVSLFPDHGVGDLERAPWLDKPAEITFKIGDRVNMHDCDPDDNPGTIIAEKDGKFAISWDTHAADITEPHWLPKDLVHIRT